ncbi:MULTISPECIES: CotY/CotZ family spore coat protein [Bacillus]|uniref:CotY/CotZ family spore coat protein n=1 Tax=Bacillus TaxID=1386 RepID=UPI000BB855FA|nr:MULTISPECIES: CotY/CotZ family spore coat protein [Bacillus]
MSCGKDFNTGSCVCDILAAIAAEQSDNVGDCCESSCERSLRELVGGARTNGFNTIPVQLICTTANTRPGASAQDTCGTVFQATGYRRRSATLLESATSTFFRVKSVDNNGCAVLELLCGVENPKGKGKGCPSSDTIDIEDFERTGICITIDCTCFCGIVCLPAVNIPRA